MRRLLAKALRRVAFAVYCGFVASILLFLLFEFRPSLLDHVSLDWLRYYAIRHQFKPDAQLVFVPPDPGPKVDSGNWYGDLYRPEWDHATPVRYRMSYTASGFRVNSSRPPYDALFVGDSFVETGVNDSGTLSEVVHSMAGVSTYNLGRAFYGPEQYLQLMRTYGVTIHPKVAFFCYFGGNDRRDLAEFARWRKSGRYYFLEDFRQRSIISRYGLVIRELASQIVGVMRRTVTRIRHKLQPGRADPDLAFCDVGGRIVPMRFVYWSHQTPEEIAGSPEGKRLAEIVGAFRNLCEQNGIEPVILYLPRKSEIYDQFCTRASGAEVLNEVERQRPFRDAESIAVGRVAAASGVRFISLLAPLRREAAAGRLLYYSFDSHWNSDGISVAGRAISSGFFGR